MDNREAIIEAAIALINEKGERINEITVREICKKANVGLGHSEKNPSHLPKRQGSHHICPAFLLS